MSPDRKLVVVVALLACAVDAYDPWPLPQVYKTGSDTVAISADLAFEVDGENPSNILQGALDRYSSSITGGLACSEENASKLRRFRAKRAAGEKKDADALRKSGESGAVLKSCSVAVASDPAEPSLTEGSDESYTLSVGSDGSCSLKAPEVWGALRGLETLSALAGEACTVETAPVEVADAPRFGYRGLMVDSARHFLPVAFLEHVVDAMVALKLNVLHWHISDSQSFPSGSALYPKLNEAGAYLFPEASYGVGDLAGVVAYARARGVRVMPEWDMPGHGSWGMGYPELMISDGPCDDTLDPTRQTTYDFLAAFLQEMGTYFTDPYLFLGGDEVKTECFTGSPSVSAWMAEHGVPDGEALQSYFWQQVTKQVLPGLNRTLGVWIADDGIPYPEDLPPGSFGDVWQSQDEVAAVVDRGAQAVLSGPWYLDVQKPGGYETYALQMLWKGMYQVEPLYNLTAAQQAMVLGGQACMWGEGINDGNFDAMALTKAAAVAERLWSPADVTDLDSATSRLIEHVCRLNMRGFDAEPIFPGFCLTDVL